MRIAFAANPLPGHIVPMVPLMRAALAAGHRVAVITGADAAAFVLAQGSPDIEVLPAGPPTLVAMADMQRETGTSPATAPRPDTIAEYFAVRRPAAAVEDAVEVARAWQPDVVISESLDHVGPYVAEALDVPFLRHSFGPERPEAVRSAMAAASARLAAERGVELPPVAAWIDVYPAFLEAPGTVRDGRRIPLRPSAHGALGGAPVPAAPPRTRPRVLVTMGTVFTDQALLDRAVASSGREGLAVDLVTTVVNGVQAHASADDSPVQVVNVPFRPLVELLAEVDAVVTVGGAGTVLGALVAGVPLVVMPLGADHAVNAARATATGAAITVDSPEAVGPALRRVLEDDAVRRSAEDVAARIRALPPVETVLAEVEQVVATAARERV
ncbi:glycosyltransferase [Curtobacterium sp. L1-20]|uniref:glycosyltransferase n=1 Tax=Curtobacterium sp. L1-20 TaxID=3138181 RepID=UPI003B522A7F